MQHNVVGKLSFLFYGLLKHNIMKEELLNKISNEMYGCNYIDVTNYKKAYKLHVRIIDELVKEKCNLPFVNNCLDKEHMRVVFEQSRSTKANFEDWYNFNYPNCC